MLEWYSSDDKAVVLEQSSHHQSVSKITIHIYGSLKTIFLVQVITTLQIIKQTIEYRVQFRYEDFDANSGSAKSKMERFPVSRG